MTRPQPYTVQVLQDLYKNGELFHAEDVWIEPNFGAVARVRYSDGGVRVVQLNDIGVNSSAAVAFVKDKGHTRQVLDQLGYNVPRGTSVLLPWWAHRLGLDDDPMGPDAALLASGAAQFASESLGFPVYVKSAHGSLGRSVWRCDSAAAVEDALTECARRRVRVAVVEAAVDLPDYRLFVLDESVPIAYERVPLSVTGDGISTIGQLLDVKRADDRAEGRHLRIATDDERIQQRLQRSSLSLDTVLTDGQRVQLLDVSNLSTGGLLRDVGEELHAHWKNLAVSVAKDFGLRCCGVDIACSDITRPDSSYAIFELNGTPGLDHYAAGSAQRDARARAVLAGVFNSAPAAVAPPSAHQPERT